jgi:hypothetical protein
MLIDLQPLYRSVPPSLSSDEPSDPILHDYSMTAVQQDVTNNTGFGFEQIVHDPTLTSNLQIQPAAFDPTKLYQSFDLLGDSLDFPACCNEFSLEGNAQL